VMTEHGDTDACPGHHGATLDALYKSADLALYDAKRAGGNQYRWSRGGHQGGGAQSGTQGAAGAQGVSDDMSAVRKKSEQSDQDEI
jgi:hypothetical protein